MQLGRSMKGILQADTPPAAGKSDNIERFDPMALYLVTGIAGFIGSSIARELLRRGESVRGLDNFITGKPENLADFRERIDFRELDLLDLAGVADACRGVDYVLHQAAIPSVPRSVANPIESNRANVDGTLNLLVAARDARVKRVVYASSSSLYGDTPTLPKREDMMPNPISPYAVSKLTGEYYMTSFYRVYGLETVSLRYFNVFGPYQDPTFDVLRRAGHLHLQNAGRRAANHLRRRRAEPRLHLH